MADTAVEEYAAGLQDWRGDVIRELDAIVREAAPSATALIRWTQLVWEHGGPIAYARAVSTHVTFGFWRGAELTDAEGSLEGSGDRMMHVEITGPGDVRKAQFAAWVKEAADLNEAMGDPTKRQAEPS
jgi:hypothetical protein